MRTVAVAVALAAACAGPAGSGPDATPSGTTPPTPSAAPLALQFSRSAQLASAGSALTSVTTGGPGYVGVGLDGGDRGRALVRVSSDGATWTAVASPSFEDAVMIGVANVGGQLVALGRDTADVERDLAAVWLSRDGREWRRVPPEPAFEGAQLIAAVPGGPGIVAIGGMPRMDRAAMWTSRDGGSWERVATFDNAFIWTVAAGGPGFVAAGWRRAPEIKAAVWTSRDGREWTLAPAVAGGDNFQIRTIVPFRGGIVAAGDGLGGEGAGVWTSPDGLTWTRAATIPGSTITTLVPVGPELVAVGGRGDAAAVWISADGRAWRDVVDDELAGAYLTSAVADARRIVAVGATQERIAGTGSYLQYAAAWMSALR